ncbi:YeiH family protein [Humibacter ginsenosidimutans]|uniref:YeiH family protein n=1 Tax=Humibacter ginsenosidimutans TaxID=2599293 RepID=UPI001FEEA7A7|nr:putative sulfate exporter family transporter [Humibacter ginsenosidimutans]
MSSAPAAQPSRGVRALRIIPGLALALALAVISTVIGRFVPLVGSAVPGIVLGVIIGILLKPAVRLKPGIAFASKFVLQLSVVILGTQLSIGEVAHVGLESLPVMLGTLVICLAAAWLFGRMLGVIGDVRTLIGVGTGICGASAIAAVAPVIGAVSADVAYAVSTIFLFNITAVIVFPLVGHALGMTQHAFGLFAGTAVNDTSSVVAAASTYGSAAANYAVVVKLVRTLMIIPISIVLAALVGRGGKARRLVETAEESAHGPAPVRLSPWRVLRLIPWFLVGFVVMALINSTGVIPAAIHPALNSVSIFLIATALSAIGLSTDIAALRRAGARPLLLGALLWITVSVASLALQWATQGGQL